MKSGRGLAVSRRADYAASLSFLARVEHRAVDLLRGHADEASALAIGDPKPFRLVCAALASSRGCVACFFSGVFSLDSISVAVR